jgi:WD40 repeat protein
MNSTSPDNTGRDSRLDEVIAAYLEAVEAGRTPDRGAWLAQHPDLADDLRAFLANHDRMAQVGAPLRALVQVEIPVESSIDPTLGRVRYFGDYELLEEIARGGMGVVYKARQVSLNRVVALKMILAGHLASADDVRRFRTEAEAAANLDHSHIVPIYEIGEHQGQHYFSMKLIEGGSLAGRISDMIQKPQEAGWLLAVVARAVHHAHQRGILHRDLKPGNILIDAQGQPHVTDFGLARRVERDSGLTHSGAIVGTPSYMAPEQARSEKVLSTGVDVYGLGAILYELLVGYPPFRAATPLDTLLQVLEREPRSPRSIRPQSDRDLETICLKCLHKDPDRRYESAAALADDLGRWRRGEPIQARRTGVLERTWKWARRRPAVALMTGGIAAFLLLSLVLGAAYLSTTANLREAQARQTLSEEHAALESIQREAEERRRQDAENARSTEQRLRLEVLKHYNSARTALYINRVIRAQFEWKGGSLGRADHLLDDCPLQSRDWEWRYVKRLCHPELLTLKGHADSVISVCFSPDGKRLVSASADKTVKVWDAATGQVVHTLTGHTGPVVRVCFSPDGKRLASASVDKTVRIWDTTTGQLVRTLEQHANPVTSVCFSPDGKRLASTSQSEGDGAVRVWDSATGEEEFSLKRQGGFLAVCFSPDGKQLAAAPVAGPVKLWDVDTRREAVTFKGNRAIGLCFCVCFSPDGKQLAAGSLYFVVMVWDAGTGEVARTLQGHSNAVLGVCFSPDSKRLASASADKTVKVWDPATGQLVRTIEHAAAVSSVCFSPDGTRLASATMDGTVKVWPADTPPEALTLTGHSGAVYGACFSPDGKRLASMSSDRTVRVWDTATGQEVFRLKGQTGLVGFSKDGERLFSSSTGKAIKAWDAATGQEMESVPGPDSGRCFSADGKWLASASRDGMVTLWDTATGQVVRTLQGHTQDVQRVCFSPDGRRLATAARDHTITLWDVATGRDEGTLRGHTSFINGMCFSPDGGRLASASQDMTAKVWDAATGQVVHDLTGHNAIVADVCFSPDGRRLASASQDQTVKLWDMGTGQETLILKGHTDIVASVRFSPDGNRLASASYDGTVRIWDATALPEARADQPATPRP